MLSKLENSSIARMIMTTKLYTVGGLLLRRDRPSDAVAVPAEAPSSFWKRACVCAI